MTTSCTDTSFIITALRSNTKTVRLANKKIKCLPKSLGLLVNLEILDLRRNNLSDLPEEATDLVSVSIPSFETSLLSYFCD